MPIPNPLDATYSSLNTVWGGIVAYVPAILVAIVVFLVAWFIGAALGQLVNQLIKSAKLDQGLRQTGLNAVVERAGFSLDSGAFIGALVKWFVVVLGLIASLDIVGGPLLRVNDFLEKDILTYIPQVIIAVLMILIGAVIAELAKDVVTGSAKAAGIHGAGFAGSIAKWAVWIFTLLIALDRLGVTPFAQTLFTGFVVAVSLAFGLAFGLGGQEAAARFIEKMRTEMTNHHH